jgi:thermitase
VRRLLASAGLVVCALGLAAPAAAQDFAPGELIVRFSAGADAADRASVLAHRRAAVRHGLGLRGLTLVRLQRGDSVEAAAAAFERKPDVLYAHPNYVYRPLLTPNDPSYGQLWGLNAIRAPQAWDTITASTVTVGVVDTGVDVAHPDLASNIWTNPAELDNGVDDDGNGKVDDVNGWDFVDENETPDDLVGHGTHVAGTIGARGNNGLGITGVAWQVKLAALKAGNPGGFYGDDIIQAFNYACAKGMRIVNGSFGGYGDLPGLRDSIEACPTTLFVFAAGNHAVDIDYDPLYPCAYGSANIVCVAASDPLEELAWFSNYGPRAVDLAAPGEGIYSTVPGAYDTYDGTSMAAPHVAGAAALVAAHRPALTTSELRGALLNSADSVSGLGGLVCQSRRLNLNAALSGSTSSPASCAPLPPPPPAPAPPPPPGDTTAPVDPAVASTSHVPGLRSIDATVEVTWSGAVDFGSGLDGFSFSFDAAPATLPDAVKDAEESGAHTVSGALAPGNYWFHLRTRDNAGNWSSGTHIGPFVIAPAAVPQPQRCRVPKVRGKTLRAAATTLKRAGCRLGPVKRVRSRVKKGRIVSQRPPAGRAVGKGTRVVVTVSRGRKR